MKKLNLLAALSLAISNPALAQDAAALPGDDSVFDGDFLIVGLGLAGIPSYQGSNDTAVIPAFGVMGRIGGIGINPRAAGFALDLLPEADGQRLGFAIGPVLRYRANRASRIKDPVVERLGELPSVIEAGANVGATLKHIFNDHDHASISADVRWDISGKGGGRTISPSLSYFTPLSRAQVFGAQVSGEFIDQRFADFNFTIDGAGALASALPAYRARSGFKELSLAAFTARDLSGDFLDGGFAIGAGAMWSRLHGSAAESPVTSVRGSRNQWFFGGGVSYTF